MIRYILYICIVLYVTYMGYFLSEKYRKRRSYFDALEKFHDRFLNELNYKKSPLPDIVAAFPATGEFKKTLDEYTATHVFSPKKLLTEEENSFLGEYFSVIGKSDGAGQQEYFSSVSPKIKDYFSQSKENAKKYTDLYVRLGFLLGLALIVCLI